MKNLGKNLRFVLQLLFSAGVLGWLTHKLGAGDIWRTFQHATPGVIAGCVLLYLLAQLLSAWRWASISRMFGYGGDLRRYNSLYFLGMFYNIFLPTGYGGDLVKTFYQAPDRAPPSKVLAALTILLDRFTGFVALLFLGGLASWGLSRELGVYGIIMSWGFVVCVILLVCLLRPLSRWKLLPRKLRFIFLTMQTKSRQFIPIGALSLVIQLLNVGVYLWLFQSLGAPLSFAAVCFCYCLVTIATLLPVSVGGLGVRESGWAALLIPFGLAPELGVTAGLLYFFIQTLCSLLGLVPFFHLKHEKDHTLIAQKP